jgi:hypothetical protein
MEGSMTALVVVGALLWLGWLSWLSKGEGRGVRTVQPTNGEWFLAFTQGEKRRRENR